MKNYWFKSILAGLVVCVALSGCGVDEDGNIVPVPDSESTEKQEPEKTEKETENEKEPEPEADTEAEFELVEINGTSITSTHNHAEVVNLAIGGTSNTITIASNVNFMAIAGIQNQVTINENTNVQTIVLGGLNNVLTVPESLKSAVSIDGIDNTVTYY